MRGTRLTEKPIAWLAAGALLLATAASVGAEEEPARHQWKFNGEVYLWGASIKGDTNAGDPIDIEFSDLLKNGEAIDDLYFSGPFAGVKFRF